MCSWFHANEDFTQRIRKGDAKSQRDHVFLSGLATTAGGFAALREVLLAPLRETKLCVKRVAI